ncbi:MAG: TldD/PmbA family protein [Methanocellales archaeon]|nr:TldD/PmbA family protein [Methanocellales archaeon]
MMPRGCDMGSIVERAEQAGADEVEVFHVDGKVTSIDIKRDEVSLAERSIIYGMGIRASVDGAVGFSSTNDFTKVEEVIENAIRYAAIKSQDAGDWRGFPSNSKYPKVDGVFDKKLHDIGLSACIDLCCEMIDGAKSVERAMPTSGSFACSSSTRTICNSNGIMVCESGTLIEGSIDSVARDGDISTASEFDISRSLDIDFYQIGFNASDLASRSLNGITIESGEVPVLFRPTAFADIIGHALVPSLSADNVQKGRSALCGRLGTAIASEELDIIDDGLLAKGVGTARMDDEGTPSQKSSIIVNGMLENFLYDCYTAGKDARKSTGNGVRHSYSSAPSVGIRNMTVQYPPTDIISETSHGILVSSVIGMHTANPVSGDFSVEARNAFMIRDGSICEPVKSLMISGNVFELLQKIDGAGFDVRAVGNILTPTVRVSNQRVIGSRG